uniref:Uncharacterized protein n=1 Tax=Bartonella rochalimae ATCC BAA-1498 TaxID=685782 RepID=E6YN72_9HYPH|nr:hypothetical protein BARRO_120084 [Bartonella rochalimae ATCC BAA-1498]
MFAILNTSLIPIKSLTIYLEHSLIHKHNPAIQSALPMEETRDTSPKTAGESYCHPPLRSFILIPPD